MALLHTPSITPQELAEALQIARAVSADQSQPDSTHTLTSFDLGDGTTLDLDLIDNPKTRAMWAVLDQFGDQAIAVMVRLEAFMDMLSDPRIEDFKFTPTGRGGRVIDDSVFEVAAIMPLNSKGLFNLNTFFKRVERRMNEVTSEYWRCQEAGVGSGGNA